MSWISGFLHELSEELSQTESWKFHHCASNWEPAAASSDPIQFSSCLYTTHLSSTRFCRLRLFLWGILSFLSFFFFLSYKFIHFLRKMSHTSAFFKFRVASLGTIIFCSTCQTNLMFIALGYSVPNYSYLGKDECPGSWPLKAWVFSQALPSGVATFRTLASWVFSFVTFAILSCLSLLLVPWSLRSQCLFSHLWAFLLLPLSLNVHQCRSPRMLCLNILLLECWLSLIF